MIAKMTGLDVVLNLKRFFSFFGAWSHSPQKK